MSFAQYLSLYLLMKVPSEIPLAAALYTCCALINRRDLLAGLKYATKIYTLCHIGLALLKHNVLITFAAGYMAIKKPAAKLALSYFCARRSLCFRFLYSYKSTFSEPTNISA